MSQQATTGFANGAGDKRRGIDYIGVSCAFLCHDGNGKFLLHKRSKNCRDEQGKWEFGASAHEFGETLEGTIVREVREEYGARAFNLQFVTVHDAFRKLDDGTPTHWLVVTYLVQVDPGQVTNNEPAKADEIGWFTLETLPAPLHSLAMREVEAARSAGLL